MDTIEIVYWLRDKAARAPDLSWTRMLNLAADRLKELDSENEELKQRLCLEKG